MIVNNVVASITPDVAEPKKETAAPATGEFGAVLQAAADDTTKTAAAAAGPDAAGQSDSPASAGAEPRGCSHCHHVHRHPRIDVRPVSAGSTGGVPETGNGEYAVSFSWYMRLSGDVERVEPSALRLFHDVARKVTDVFLGNEGWSGNPVHALLTGTETSVEAGQGKVQPYLESLLSAAESGIRSLTDALNGRDAVSGLGTLLKTGSNDALSGLESLLSSSSKSTAFGGIGAFADLALVKLKYGSGLTGGTNDSGASSADGLSGLTSLTSLSGFPGLGSTSASGRPLPRNRLGERIVMVSGNGAAVSSGNAAGDGAAGVDGVTSNEAARRFLEAFKVFVESLKKDMKQEAEPAEEPAVKASPDDTLTA
ncbi:MAG TPA: hypothetical protein PLP29_04165 [Candidatus Ozemobacteraceae bacterium]|nr:hypothetical protein [Candidatus Ozemobacteraceae bacterium]